MRKTSQSGHSTMNELNITPLLDLAFVLLVIFIITTPQLVNNLEMNLPSPKQNNPGPPPKLNYVTVDAKGRIFLNQEEQTLPSLRPALAQLKASEGDPSVVVRGGADVDYQNIINVLDLLRQLDITKVGLATDTVAAQ
ncbi:MAG TPA: biopolymer transporter ExbD [Verrucomicrobiae bacterium]|nr:biopolymer transporter ExbD [Verrucomicrobiae bacterium]